MQRIGRLVNYLPSLDEETTAELGRSIVKFTALKDGR